MANNMNLILDDDYIADVKNYVNAATDDANRKLDVLIQTVNAASTDGCISGQTADVLKQFAKRMSNLSDVILEYGKICINLADEFYNEIDNIDENLY